MKNIINQWNDAASKYTFVLKQTYEPVSYNGTNKNSDLLYFSMLNIEKIFIRNSFFTNIFTYSYN